MGILQGLKESMEKAERQKDYRRMDYLQGLQDFASGKAVMTQAWMAGRRIAPVLSIDVGAMISLVRKQSGVDVDGLDLFDQLADVLDGMRYTDTIFHMDDEAVRDVDVSGESREAQVAVEIIQEWVEEFRGDIELILG